MKVGILTLTYKKNLNYGAALQAWALKTAVQKYTGNDSVVIPMEPELSRRVRHKYSEKKQCVWRGVRKWFANFKVKKNLFREIRDLERYERYQRFRYFLENFAFDGRESFLADDVDSEIDEEINALLIGSDWVWNLPESLLNADPLELPLEKAVYFGFLPSSALLAPPRIAYAASQGIVPRVSSTLLRQALGNFSSVSVREVESVQYLTENGAPVHIHHVVDPTLLIEEDDLKTIERQPTFDIPELKEKNYILVYELFVKNENDPLPKYVQELSRRTGLKICNISTRADAPLISNEALGEKIGPMEFLSLLKNSCYVVTNSFHGMVFASLYHKPFTAFQRQANDFRQLNLVRLLNMENRLLSCKNCSFVGTDLDPFAIEPDWKQADVARRAAAARSIDFLKRSLNNVDSSH